MDFFKSAGPMALGSKIRHVAEQITGDAAQIYEAYNTDLNPKWFPVFFYLSRLKTSTVTEIAEDIGHSHASVSKILKEMSKVGLVSIKTDGDDKRRSLVSLSKSGFRVSEKIEDQYKDVSAAIKELSEEAAHDLWSALNEWSDLLKSKPLLRRVLEKKKIRESAAVKIEPFKPKFKSAFRELNEEWITTYFKLEQPDIDALSDPKGYILDQGGFIFVATDNGAPVGVCALVKKDKKVVELAKMAVSPKARGKNIGFLLGQAAIEKAREMKAERVYLESNTILKPAINLYKKLGFKKVTGLPTPYERCNIQMELELK